jgi:hypothetical protein
MYVACLDNIPIPAPIIICLFLFIFRAENKQAAIRPREQGAEGLGL